jgi:ketosteroid isomerase-like protein
MKSIRIFILLFFSISLLNLNAQTKDEKAVAAAVQILNKSILKPDRAVLESVTSVDLSYGHSTGKIENKKDFVDLLVNGYYVYSTLNTIEQTIQVSGNTAVVRHHLIAKLTIGGTPADMNLGVLQVWRKEKSGWRLLARQGFKLP